jgi:hypothetical protein
VDVVGWRPSHRKEFEFRPSSHRPPSQCRKAPIAVSGRIALLLLANFSLYHTPLHHIDELSSSFDFTMAILEAFPKAPPASQGGFLGLNKKQWALTTVRISHLVSCYAVW